MSRYGDTRGTVRLCDTCRWSVILKGTTQTEELVKCQYYGSVPFSVVECKTYTERGRLTLHEMEYIATVLEFDARGSIGFRSPKDRISDSPMPGMPLLSPF